MDISDSGGKTALMIAIQNNEADIVKFLCDKQIEIDRKDDLSNTALHFAVSYDNLTCSQILIDRAPPGGANINIKNSLGRTSLMTVAARNLTQIFNVLYEKGVELDTQDNFGCTALMSASTNGHVEILERLISSGVNIDLQDIDGMTALMLSVKKNYIALVEILISAGARLDIKDINGKTAYDLSVSNIQLMYLLDNSIINNVDADGNTFLIKACYEENEKDIFFLIEHGTDMSSVNKKGQSFYDILINKNELSEKLEALKDKLMLEKSIDYSDENNMCLGL